MSTDTKETTEHWLPLHLDDHVRFGHQPELVEENYHLIDGGCGYLKDGALESGIGLAGCMTRKQAAFIVRACNSHEALVDLLQEALDSTVDNSPYPDGPNMDRDLRKRICAALANLK